MDFKGLHYAGFLKPYREPHRWARLILQLLGHDPLEVWPESCVPGLPPFALNMNELFERYCEVGLRQRKGQEVWAGYSDHNLGATFPVRPDFLVADRTTRMGWIVDAKYKSDWSWNAHRPGEREDRRHDIYQLMAYSRHLRVLQTLKDLIGCTDEPHVAVVILYPHETFTGQSPEILDLTKVAPNDILNEFQIQLTRLRVPLPS